MAATETETRVETAAQKDSDLTVNDDLPPRWWASLGLTSESLLQDTEERLLSGVKSLEPGVLVDIGPVVSSEGDRVLTYRANSRSSNTPLVLLHGFGCGSGFWCLNIDQLARDRPVYVIDILGFGRSSRPTFSSDPLEAEREFVRSLEAWRRVMGLQRFYLLGHSFGGYLASLYAMSHPERVHHLVLADPWGYPARPPGHRVPMWVRPVEVGAAWVLPLFALRAAGPLGYLYLRLVPPFCTRNFYNVSDARRVTADYFFHLNVKKPSGERAFHRLMGGITWARYPLLPRLDALRKEVPVTFIYGEKSWVSKTSGYAVQQLRAPSYVDVQVVAGAGHSLCTDQPLVFNAIVGRVLRGVDDATIPCNSLTSAPLLGTDVTGAAVWQEQGDASEGRSSNVGASGKDLANRLGAVQLEE